MANYLNKYALIAVMFFLFTGASCGGGEKKDASMEDGDVLQEQAEDAADVSNDQKESGSDTKDSGKDLFDSGTDAAEEQDLADAVEEAKDSSETGETAGPKSFSSPELFIKILGPSGEFFGNTAGSYISLTGVLFGDADSLTWEIKSGGSGTIEMHPFWLSDMIEVKQGDNQITVKAENGSESVYDSIMITYNPGFLFQDPPLLRPYAVFKGESTNVIVTVPLGTYKNFDENTVKLVEVDKDMKIIKEHGQMLDNGDLYGSGDEIPKDGVFTKKVTINCSTEGLTYFRVSVDVKTALSTYTAYSSPSVLECMSHINLAECNDVVSVNKQAEDLYKSKLNEVGKSAAVDAVVQFFKQNGNVQEAGKNKDGTSAWVLYKSGILGGLNFAENGYRGGNEDDPENMEESEQEYAQKTGALTQIVKIASKKALLMSPYSSEFGANDESNGLGTYLKQKVCPNYNVQGPLINQQATMQKFREMKNYGIISVVSHGNSFFNGMTEESKKKFGWHHMGAQEGILSGEALNCAGLFQSSKTCTDYTPCPAGTDCIIQQASGKSFSGICIDSTQVDLKRGRTFVSNGGNVGILPAFIQFHSSRNYPDSFVYLGTCKSVYNGSIASAFFAGGAKSIAGFSGNVTSKFAATVADKFFSTMVKDEKLTGEAIPADNKDPSVPGTEFRIFGGLNLTVSDSKIINEDFERGDLTGWDRDGDARVITKFGITKPVIGKFMGIISSGMGYTVTTGTVEQTFCVPKDIQEFYFYWKFYSEEFHEYCGSIFQDTFTAQFTSQSGSTLEIVNVAIDDLCDPDDCANCCASEKCVGLIPSDIPKFDIGDVHTTPKWQKAKINVTPVAGAGPVNLSFFCTDKGDSIFDTVILFDSLKFK
jgi:hypothetical protein